MASRVWPAVEGIAYGGDYNPEQWPREVWEQDMALMKQAGVNLVSVGIFSWALLEPSEGRYDFEWLDDLLDLLHSNGIAADLGTPTAAPPAWFYATYPEARVVNRDGVAMGPGSRGACSPSSPLYRAAAARIAGELAKRYAQHPAVVMWHVHNEYGTPVGEDFSDVAVQAFRAWLQNKYGTLDALNAAWGTAFWGQRYGKWEHVGAPGATPSVPNPAQKLDFARFTDHQLLECYRAERDAIRAHASQPITTNFMANECFTTDLFAWGKEVDIVSNDHYLCAGDPEGEIGLALAADLSRSVGGSKPWILMEHSSSAVNWQPRNIAKRPGELARNSLSHFGRGADAVMFFQWRASRSGAEKFHSAMLPHAGTGSRVWKEVVALGKELAATPEAVGTRVTAEVAILWDMESIWAQGLEWRPSQDHTAKERLRAFYERLWRDNVTVDFAHPSQDLSRYSLVLAPASYLLTLENAAKLESYVKAGGTLVVSYFSAIVDEHDAVHEGGFLAPLKGALGVTVDEFLPMREGERAALSFDGAVMTADVWAEDLRLAGAQVLATYLDGPAAGLPAITRNNFGQGSAWYISTRLDAQSLSHLMTSIYADAGIELPGYPEGTEVIRRRGNTTDVVVALNHRDVAVDITVEQGLEPVHLEAGGYAIVRLPGSLHGEEDSLQPATPRRLTAATTVHDTDRAL